MVSRKLKRRMRKAWDEYEQVSGTPSVSDAKEAFSFGIINKSEYNEVKRKHKYAHNALS